MKVIKFNEAKIGDLYGLYKYGMQSTNNQMDIVILTDVPRTSKKKLDLCRKHKPFFTWDENEMLNEEYWWFYSLTKNEFTYRCSEDCRNGYRMAEL